MYKVYVNYKNQIVIKIFNSLIYEIIFKFSNIPFIFTFRKFDCFLNNFLSDKSTILLLIHRRCIIFIAMLLNFSTENQRCQRSRQKVRSFLSGDLTKNQEIYKNYELFLK